MRKYFEMLEKIESEKLDIIKLYLLSSINMSGKSKEEEWKMVNYCYDLWLDTDIDLSLSRLADIVVAHWNEIQADEITDENIIEECLN